MPDRLLTRAEVCERLRIGMTTLEALIAERQLAVTRIRRKVLVRESAVDDYLHRATQPAVPARVVALRAPRPAAQPSSAGRVARSIDIQALCADAAASGRSL